MDGDGVERGDEGGEGLGLGRCGEAVQGEDGFEVGEECGGDVVGVFVEVGREVQGRCSTCGCFALV